MTNVTTCKLYGTPCYAVSERTYKAYLPLAALTSTTAKAGLFVIPKGSTVIAAKAYLTKETDGDMVVNVGTYNITTAGEIGTAVDADAFYTAEISDDNATGAILSAAATAKGQLTDTVVVAANASTLTTAAKEGELYIELVTVQ